MKRRMTLAVPRRSRRASVVALASIIGLASLALPLRVMAGPSDTAWRRGLALIKQGNCAKAVPLLEEAESEKHRPVTAYALAGCYVKAGELLAASDIYHALSEESVSFSS